MREILFRGKTTDRGEWVQGCYTETLKYNNLHWIWDGKNHFTVNPETVGQYTGLTDKNDKKIFEGDIVRDFIPFNFEVNGEKDFEENVYLVEYSSENGGFKPFCESDHYGEPIIEQCKIIGNIHDNPELLKGGE